MLGHPSGCPQGPETGLSAPERVHESTGSMEVLLGVEEAVGTQTRVRNWREWGWIINERVKTTI